LRLCGYCMNRKSKLTFLALTGDIAADFVATTEKGLVLHCYEAFSGDRRP